MQQLKDGLERDEYKDLSFDKADLISAADTWINLPEEKEKNEASVENLQQSLLKALPVANVVQNSLLLAFGGVAFSDALSHAINSYGNYVGGNVAAEGIAAIKESLKDDKSPLAEMLQTMGLLEAIRDRANSSYLQSEGNNAESFTQSIVNLMLLAFLPEDLRLKIVDFYTLPFRAGSATMLDRKSVV